MYFLILYNSTIAFTGRKDMVDVVPPSEHSDGENNVEKNVIIIPVV